MYNIHETTKKANTTTQQHHSRQLFRKMNCLRWDSNPQHCSLDELVLCYNNIILSCQGSSDGKQITKLMQHKYKSEARYLSIACTCIYVYTMYMRSMYMQPPIVSRIMCIIIMLHVRVSCMYEITHRGNVLDSVGQEGLGESTGQLESYFCIFFTVYGRQSLLKETSS